MVMPLRACSPSPTANNCLPRNHFHNTLRNVLRCHHLGAHQLPAPCACSPVCTQYSGAVGTDLEFKEEYLRRSASRRAVH